MTQTKLTLSQRVDELTRSNNERERSTMERTGGMFNPMLVLELKLETFFRVSLGEGRYEQYMLKYQQSRAEMIDSVEAQIRMAELQAGVDAFNLQGAGQPLGTNRDT